MKLTKQYRIWGNKVHFGFLNETLDEGETIEIEWVTLFPITVPKISIYSDSLSLFYNEDIKEVLECIHVNITQEEFIKILEEKEFRKVS